MKLEILIVLIIVFFAANCSENPDSEGEDNRISATYLNEDDNCYKMEILDTTIFLEGVNHSKYSGAELSLKLAEETLYRHYERKGYFRPDRIPEVISVKDSNKFAVYYDTIYLVDLNHNKNPDAVISFWLTPPGASGHCWQPHKAIIIDTDWGYKITNEEFIPTNFSLDHIEFRENSNILFGMDYDCSNHRILRDIKIRIPLFLPSN